MKLIERHLFLRVGIVSGLVLLAVSSLDAEQRGNITVVNIAHNHAAYQSDSADSDATAHLAIDGSTATCWKSSTNRNSWIVRVTFSSPVQWDYKHCIEHAHSPAEGRKQLQELLVVRERYVE